MPFLVALIGKGGCISNEPPHPSRLSHAKSIKHSAADHAGSCATGRCTTCEVHCAVIAAGEARARRLTYSLEHNWWAGKSD